MANLAINTETLTCEFGGVRVIDHVSLAVPSGVVFGLIGPNGAGKTTMIRLLLGLLEPTEGTATVLGLDTRTDAEEIRRRTGALIEHDSLYERLSAEENLEYQGHLWEMAAEDRRARVKELLGPLGLWERRKDPVGNWSRGMKGQLLVARALFHRPQLVFLDEPTAGLDPVAAGHLHDELLNLAAREGITVFITSHKLAEAERMCAMIGVLRGGRLLAVGSTAELRTRGSAPMLEIIGNGFTPNMVALLGRRREVADIEVGRGRLLVELNDSNAHTWPLVNLLVESGADIEEVRKAQSSLEAVFRTMLQEDAELEAQI